MSAAIIQKEKRLESRLSRPLLCDEMKSPVPMHAAILLISFLFVSCAIPTQSPSGEQQATRATSYAQPPSDRPGLGTRWGENRKSPAREVRFVRANKNEPVAMAKIFYNDRAGIEAMANASALRREWPRLSAPAANLVSVAIRDQNGSLLPGLIVDDRWFVVGEEGRRYSIELRNRSDERLEAVVSVDGLDVIDGRPASLGKRGYVIDPHRSLIIDGFRQSLGTVAAFRFSPVRESYAYEKYRNSRNAGVIGIAIFNEKGSEPWTEREVQKRLHANPFPGRSAGMPDQ
jgi:hypothetical protein